MSPSAGLGRPLVGVDGLMWRTGSVDRGLRWVICAVVLLDAAPQWQRFRARWQHLVHRVPVLRERPVYGALGLSLPRLAAEHEFDLDLHLRRIALPQPGSWEQVMAEARRMSLIDFDAMRPLWRAALVEGLPDGRAAVVLAMHHAIADGQSAVLIGASLFDLSRDADPGPVPEEAWAAARARSVRVSGANIADNLARLGRLGRTVATASVRAARNPVAAAAHSREVLESLDRIRPADGPMMSPLMTGRCDSYTTATTSWPFDQIRDAARRLGASVNDVYLAAVADGAARYHDRHGRPATSLRFNVPISLRESSRQTRVHNVVTLATVTMPCNGADRSQRLRAAGETVRRWRSEPALGLNQRLVEGHWLVPVSRVAEGAHAIDISASNVAGPPVPLFLAGAEVLGIWPLVSTVGTAVNVTMVTYNGTACLGVAADDRAVPDLGDFMSDFDAGMAATVAT